MERILLSALLLGLVALQPGAGHTYHFGGCPIVPPMRSFDMSKFLGLWYVVQKTSTTSWCYTYNFTAGHQPGEYLMHKSGENSAVGSKHAGLSNKFHYKGTLAVPEKDSPSKMMVSFPLNPLGAYPFVVFATDYENYAGVYTCQKMPFSNRRSASILSRTNTLDKETIENLHAQLKKNDVNADDLTSIDHSHCVVSGVDPGDHK